jgi:hypothetical protein
MIRVNLTWHCRKKSAKIFIRPGTPMYSMIILAIYKKGVLEFSRTPSKPLP